MRRNIEMVQIIAEGLDDLKDHVVFVGGSIIELYADSVIPEEVRPTEDVDLIVNIATRKSFAAFEKQLSRKGFCHDLSEGAPLCRWQFNGISVDLMATDSGVFGFGNQWYESGFKRKVDRVLPDKNKLKISLLPLIYYLATKVEAVLGRGLKDLRLSHDFEDIVYLFDNCTSIEIDFSKADGKIQEFLSHSFNSLVKMPLFKEALDCSMPRSAEIDRVAAVEKIMLKIASTR